MKKMGKGRDAKSSRIDRARASNTRNADRGEEDTTWADVDLSVWLDSSEPQLSFQLEF